MYDNDSTNYAVVTKKGESPTPYSQPLRAFIQTNPHALGNMVAMSYIGGQGHGIFVFVPLKKGDTIHIM